MCTFSIHKIIDFTPIFWIINTCNYENQGKFFDNEKKCAIIILSVMKQTDATH